MAASSGSSTKEDKRSTPRTVSLTQEQAIEILQQAVKVCQQTGLVVGVSTLYRAGNQNAIIVIENVDFIDGNFVLANAGKE
jgi:hypothetical protein